MLQQFRLAGGEGGAAGKVIAAFGQHGFLLIGLVQFLIQAGDGDVLFVPGDHLPGEVHDLVVERDGQKVYLDDFRMEKHEVTDEEGNKQMLYGFSFSVEEATPASRLEYAWLSCVNTVRTVRLSLQMLFSGQASFSDVSGPVGIVSQMNDVANASDTWVDALLNMLYFGGFIAINLAVMNLLPIPALDGGRLLALLLTTGIEAVTGKKIDPKYEGYIHGIGMVLLLALMAVIMFKDIFTIFKG